MRKKIGLLFGGPNSSFESFLERIFIFPFKRSAFFIQYPEEFILTNEKGEDDMSYMAVGSRQILFSDSIAPVSTGSSSREIVATQDNQTRSPDSEVVPPGSPPPSIGKNVDVYA